MSCPDPHSECEVTNHEAQCRCKEGYEEIEDEDSTVDCKLTVVPPQEQTCDRGLTVL